MRVLIVDDHRNTRESLAIGMRVAGFDVDTAASAAQASVLTARRAYDLVVCDVRLPDVDGITLCRQIRAGHPAWRLVLITAYEVSEAESASLRDLAATLLIKPVTSAALLALATAAGGEALRGPEAI